MYVCFEIAALFTRLYSEEKRAAVSKLTYIWTPQSCSYFVLALVKSPTWAERKSDTHYILTYSLFVD